jgi:hypothetical protein
MNNYDFMKMELIQENIVIEGTPIRATRYFNPDTNYSYLVDPKAQIIQIKEGRDAIFTQQDVWTSFTGSPKP